MESYLSHQHTQFYVSILSHLSHVGQVGQSYGILPVPPTHSNLCVCPIPSVPCRTSETVLWILPVPPTHSILCVLSHLSHVGQVGQSYGILPVPPTHSNLCVCPIPSVPCRTSGTVLWNPTCPTNTHSIVCVCPISLVLCYQYLYRKMRSPSMVSLANIVCNRTTLVKAMLFRFSGKPVNEAEIRD